MRVEWMIYAYGTVCISLIVFNIIYNVSLRRSEPRLERRCHRIRAKMDEQLGRLSQGQKVDEKHLDYLSSKLKRVKNLIAFDRVLQSFPRGDKTAEAYFQQIQPIILHLAVIYRRREVMQAAYFSYLLSQYMTTRQMPVDSLQEILLDYVRKDNLYCRVNALEALYTIGTPRSILRALEIQDSDSVFIHEKILTEGLLTYTGNHDELIELLWARLDSFSVRTQLAILNYIRFETGNYAQEMFSIMMDQSRDKELRLSAIRYFGKYAYQPALPPLLAFAAEKDPAQWEYAAISVSSLARYPGPEVVQQLKEALHSSNWYVRYNASLSLEALHIDYSELIDVVAGNDRYAREMMMYRLENRAVQKGEKVSP
ncbi:MAG TPA: hypothetical protein IAC31_07960 [Candidatus Faecousia intestinigallinarum]|nr:hypothetical protein [Candidatus Faecousia intestinigallinarum]